jgi:hypothetical protein
LSQSHPRIQKQARFWTHREAPNPGESMEDTVGEEAVEIKGSGVADALDLAADEAATLVEAPWAEENGGWVSLGVQGIEYSTPSLGHRLDLEGDDCVNRQVELETQSVSVCGLPQIGDIQGRGKRLDGWCLEQAASYRT